MRRYPALLSGLLVLAVTAPSCKSTTTTSPAPATTAPAATATTGQSVASIPTVTKPATVEKVDRSKLPAKAQNAKFGSAISADEEDCIYYVVYQTVLDDPTIADDEAKLAGVTGASMVACVSQDKLALLLTEDLRGKATEDQITCVKNEITGADAESLSIFLGGLVLEEPTIVQAVSKAIDASCGTSLATM